MGEVHFIEEGAEQKGMDHLYKAVRARDALDTVAQLEHARRARLRLERAPLTPRGLAGLLHATGLEVDAHGAEGRHDEAREQAERIRELIGELDHRARPTAHAAAMRNVTRCREVAGDADAAMHEAMGTYHALRTAPLQPQEAGLEKLAALTTVVSSAHRLSGLRARAYGTTAIRFAERIIGDVRTYDARAAARFDMWAGMFLSGSANQPDRAREHLGRYIAWSRIASTPRNDVIREFAVAELVLCEGASADVVRERFHDALERTRPVLSRKHDAAEKILARRGLL